MNVIVIVRTRFIACVLVYFMSFEFRSFVTSRSNETTEYLKLYYCLLNKHGINYAIIHFAQLTCYLFFFFFFVSFAIVIAGSDDNDDLAHLPPNHIVNKMHVYLEYNNKC